MAARRTAAHIPPMPKPRSRIPAIVAALPDFGLAALFLATWIAPDLVGAHRIGTLLLVMLLEFIVVHSAGFMGAAAFGEGGRAQRLTWILGLGVFYTVFVGAFGAAFGTWWPLGAFWALVLNRLLGVLVGQVPSDEGKMLIMRGWAVSVMAYLGAVFATVLLPVPELGIDARVRAAANLSGGGLWIDEPQRVIAAGFLYFTVLGLSELASHGWLPMPGHDARRSRAGGA